MSAGVRPFARSVAAVPFRLICGMVRIGGLAGLMVFAVMDAAIVRLVTEPTGTRLAHARGAWLHRWSRVARRMLGLRSVQRGFTPVSGIVVANHTNLLDAIIIAAARPCVFVAGTEVRRWPILGLLAQLGGTLFVNRHRRHDIARVNFMIQRAVQRRLLVVVFPECGRPDDTKSRTFTSALFQPAAELGCTLTAAAIDYRVAGDNDDECPPVPREAHFFRQFANLVTRRFTGAVISFGAPTFRSGDRKWLARQLQGEVSRLKLHATQPV